MNEVSMKPDYVTLGFEQIRQELKFLVGAFADVLKVMGHSELAEHLPWQSSQSASLASEQLPARLGLAYSVAFQLLNMVEENAAAAMRELREFEEGLTAQKGLWGNQLARLKAQGISPEAIVAQMRRVSVEPVLTAHPTEAKRLSVLNHHRALFSLLDDLRRGLMTPTVQSRLSAEVRASLERLWRTGEILLEKPAIADERRNVMHYLREVFPKVLPILDHRIRVAWQDA